MPWSAPTHRTHTRRESSQAYDLQRGSAASRGYDAKWRKARDVYLRNNPLCVECLSGGRAVSAVVVDHIKPHRGNLEMFWDEGNWQSLCVLHHNSKTAREDGGFGR
jgi:5-methylcytosine-specific restriction protein A